VTANVATRCVPIVAIDRVMMGQPSHALASICRSLEDLLSEGTKRAAAVGEVADQTPAFIVAQHRNVIRLRPVTAEADHLLKLMRRRQTSNGVLIVPIVVTHHYAAAVVAVTGRIVRRRVGEALHTAGLQIPHLKINAAAEFGFDDQIPSGLVHLDFIEIPKRYVREDSVLISAPNNVTGGRPI